MKRKEYKPDYIVTPGEVLADYMETFKISNRELSRLTSTDLSYVELVLSGKESFTKDFSSRLDTIFGNPDGKWYRIEMSYQKESARQRMTT